MNNCQPVQKSVLKSDINGQNGRVLDAEQIYLIDLSVSLVLIMTMALAYIVVWVRFRFFMFAHRNSPRPSAYENSEDSS